MKTDWMVLGENCRFSMDSNVTGLNNNVIVCGGSGSGKTMSVTEPRLLETKNSSLIVTVTKRRIVEKYMVMFRMRGYEVLDLNLADPSRSAVSFDPLARITKDEDIRQLAEAIVQADGVSIKNDPYWDNSAISLLCAEIGYVRYKDPRATFADVLDFHNSMNLRPSKEASRMFATDHDNDFRDLEYMCPKHQAVSNWKTFRNLSYVTGGCIYATLSTSMDAMFTQDVREMMRTRHSVDFERLASEKTVLFITTSAVNPALHRFVNVFYSQVFAKLFEFAENQPDGRLPIPVQVICDDFATGGRVADFPDYISIFREKQISVMLLIQSESQLKQMYGDSNATTIINNCDTYLYMGGMDIDTAMAVNYRMDKPLDEVLNMPVGRMYVFRRGRSPQQTTRYDICRDERYKKITAHYNECIRKKQLEDDDQWF